MGIFSEVAASGEANELRRILIEGIKSRSKKVMKFCSDYVYPQYASAISSAFQEEDKILKEVYSKKLTPRPPPLR